MATSKLPVYLLGDIVDIANCKYAELGDAIETLKFLNKNSVFIRGNHECDAVDAYDSVLIDGHIMLSHGDIPMWKPERVKKFRGQKWGAGWFKRNIVSKLIHEGRRFIEVRPNERLVAWIEKQIEKNSSLEYFVFGHSHPPKPVFFTVKGRACVILPRGCHDLSFVKGEILWSSVS